MIRELNKHELAYEKIGYKIDDSLSECEDHCSQKMWNKDDIEECVICTGNEIAFIMVEV